MTVPFVPSARGGHINVATDALEDSWKSADELSLTRHGDLSVGAWWNPDPFTADVNKAGYG
jgi:hypothetical protein